MINPDLPIIPVNDAPAPQGRPVKRGSTALRTRVFLDVKSLERLTLVREYVEREFGARLSLSHVLRLALRNLSGQLATAAGAGDELGRRIKSAYEGQ
jgi:hypothetical protein